MAEIIPDKPNQDDPETGNAGWFEPKNVEYRVKAEDYDIKEAAEDSKDSPNASGEPFSVGCDWNVNSEGTPDQGFQERTGITWWKIEKAPWYSPFTWQLTFNCRDSYHYIFTDETDSSGGSYHVDVYVNGVHSVQYRSDRPKIHKVSGS